MNQNFSIYSDTSLPSQTTDILADVRLRLSQIEIDQPDRIFTLFISQESSHYETFANLAGKPARSQGMNIQPLYYTFINYEHIKTISGQNRINPPYSLLNGDPAHIITHELIHELIALKVGFLKSRFIPKWKVEGYAEFYASNYLRSSDPDYRFINYVENYLNGTYNRLSAGHFSYIESMLFIEYLVVVEKLNFEELIAPTVTFNSTRDKLKAWYEESEFK
jgi:hypothetical protein